MDASPAIHVRDSNNEWPVKVCGAKAPVLLNAKRDWFRNLIKPQIVLRPVDFIKKFSFKRIVFHCIKPTFEYRLLNALTIPFARLGDPSQAPTTGARFGRDVISHDYEHNTGFLMGEVRQVALIFAADSSCKHPRLHERYESQRHFPI